MRAQKIPPTAEIKNKTSLKDEKKSSSRRILSYNEQRLLTVLPEQISQTEKEIEKIKKQLDNSNLYQQDPAYFVQLTKKLEELEAKKEDDENHWLEISLKAEKNSLH